MTDHNLASNPHKVAMQLRPRLAWWVRPYLFGALVVATVTRSTPDWEKLRRVIGDGIKIEVAPL